MFSHTAERQFTHGVWLLAVNLREVITLFNPERRGITSIIVLRCITECKLLYPQEYRSFITAVIVACHALF